DGLVLCYDLYTNVAIGRGVEQELGGGLFWEVHAWILLATVVLCCLNLQYFSRCCLFVMGILTVTGDEIEQVTRKKRRQAQAKVLKALGIRLQIRPDGTLLVFRTSLGIPH
ncbi:DUF4224 domain-containing protein, partial [Bordetella pertussis]